MSTIILNPIHYNSVEIGIKRLCNDKTFCFGREEINLFPQLNSTAYNQSVTQLMDSIRHLTVLSYCSRYREENISLEDDVKEQTEILMSDRKFKYLSNTALYMALTSALYQIDFENLEELPPTKLEHQSYECLQHLTNTLAKHIVSKLDEYNTVEWAIQ